jgi:hypothetical protein
MRGLRGAHRRPRRVLRAGAGRAGGGLRRRARRTVVRRTGESACRSVLEVRRTGPAGRRARPLRPRVARGRVRRRLGSGAHRTPAPGDRPRRGPPRRRHPLLAHGCARQGHAHPAGPFRARLPRSDGHVLRPACGLAGARRGLPAADRRPSGHDADRRGPVGVHHRGAGRAAGGSRSRRATRPAPRSALRGLRAAHV